MLLRIIKILSVSIALALMAISCSELNNPVDMSSELTVATETKWMLDTETDEKLYKIHYNEYDKNGNIKKNINYFENGNINFKSVFEYQGQDTSIEEKTVFDEAGNIIDETRTDYIYNNNGNIEKSIKYNDDGEITNIFLYEYDAQGNLLKKSSSFKNDSLHLNVEYSYRYNQNGNVVERVVNDLTSPVSNIRDSVTYTSDNTVNIFKYEGNKLKTITSYLYNDYGMIFKEIVSNSEGEIISKFLYEYTYH